jgi:hypothetical protein
MSTPAARHRARIGVEVFIWAELRWVYEDRYDDSVCVPPRLLDQRHVPVMQCAHGRDQRNATHFRAQQGNLVPQWVQLIDGLHGWAALFIGFDNPAYAGGRGGISRQMSLRA